MRKIKFINNLSLRKKKKRKKKMKNIEKIKFLKKNFNKIKNI